MKSKKLLVNTDIHKVAFEHEVNRGAEYVFQGSFWSSAGARSSRKAAIIFK